VSDQATVSAPEVGQVWADGLTPGFTWRVVEIDELDRVGIVASNADGEPTESYMQWPRNRWQALVEKQLLTLVGE
jgi:hypothetical protein